MPTILLAQEDLEARQQFTALILDFFPTTKVETVESWDNLEPALAASSSASLLLTEVLWDGADRAGDLILLAEKFPASPFGLFSRYDLSGSLPDGCPLPLLAPDDALPLRLAEWMENLTGRSLGSYLLTAPAGSHLLGRLYWAKHHQLRRSVQLLAPPSGSPQAAEAIRAMARINHPSVFSLYESVPWEHRTLIALEPVLNPSLLHLRLAGQKPDLGACAQLATALGSVLAEMESCSLPARRLGEYDFTLSPGGVARLRNPAAWPGAPLASCRELAQRLADWLSPSLRGDPRGEPLRQLLLHHEGSASDLHRAARDFERQLAEVRDIRVRKEEREAAEKTRQARILRRWAIGAGVGAVLVYLSLFAHTLFRNIFLDAPGHLTSVELPVPAGPVRLEGEIREVGAFGLDRHEVTIGQYEAFLKSLRADPDWKRFLPEAERPTRTQPADLEPRDWPEILRRARKLDFYQDQKISRDTPVFNLDFASAAAYARWKGRRLPTMEEWIRAASGDDSRRYPWGDSADPAPANLGVARNTENRRDPGDAALNAAPAESFPGDRGPYGHLDLGGNVSEWAIGPNQKPVALGGNFTDAQPVPVEQSRRRDKNRLEPPPATRMEMIGFRTAR